MKTIGIGLAIASLVMLVIQSVRVLLGTEPVNSADVMVMSASLSFLSTALIAFGAVFNKGE
jgi:hypothetical protein